jgi:hypothetical protein
MEEGGFSLSPKIVAVLVIVALVTVYVAYSWFYGGPTVPLPSYKVGFRGSGSTSDLEEGGSGDRGRSGSATRELGTEGFYGGAARGAGIPDCTRSSLEGARLIALFDGRGSEYSVSVDDFRELTQIVSKLSCFKKDLVSPSHIVEATRYQNYVTAHDIEPIAETTGRCFARTIPPRDLELSFDKWTSRGELLIKRLCTEFRLSTAEVQEAEKLFRALIRDVKDIARGVCLEGEPSIAGKPGPRDAHPFVDPSLDSYGPYTGYY